MNSLLSGEIFPNSSDIKYIMSGYVRQLSLFDTETLYISEPLKETVLIGSCRKGIKDWIALKKILQLSHYRR